MVSPGSEIPSILYGARYRTVSDFVALHHHFKAVWQWIVLLSAVHNGSYLPTETVLLQAFQIITVKRAC